MQNLKNEGNYLMRARTVGLLLVMCFLLGGCGETLRGIGKDTSRVYRGTKMIFVSEEKPQPKGFHFN
jgi:predicted small secreted protein